MGICCLGSSVLCHRGFRVSAPIRPFGAFGVLPADSVGPRGATFTPTKPAAPVRWWCGWPRDPAHYCVGFAVGLSCC